jgi:hypothetical protein
MARRATFNSLLEGGVEPGAGAKWIPRAAPGCAPGRHGAQRQPVEHTGT